MGNQNYHESAEKNRQKITEESSNLPSRRSQRKAAKQKPEKEKNLLLPVLFFIFILIPVALLFYIAFLYEPEEPVTSNTMETEVSFETNTAPSKSEIAAIAEQEKAERAEAEKAEKLARQEAAAKEQAEKEAAAKAEAEAKAAAEAKAKEEAKAKAEAKAEAKAKAEAEALAQKQKEKEEAKRQQQKKEEKAPSSGKTHTVQPGETLYRIAVNNYGAAGAAAAVEKIKQANGLSSNSISPGQTLILP